MRMRYRCEKSLDNVRQGKGQGTGRRGKIQQSILFLVIKYSQSLFSPILILCNPKGASSAHVLGRRTGCHFAADRYFILGFNFSATFRLSVNTAT